MMVLSWHGSRKYIIPRHLYGPSWLGLRPCDPDLPNHQKRKRQKDLGLLALRSIESFDSRLWGSKGLKSEKKKNISRSKQTVALCHTQSKDTPISTLNLRVEHTKWALHRQIRLSLYQMFFCPLQRQASTSFSSTFYFLLWFWYILQQNIKAKRLKI